MRTLHVERAFTVLKLTDSANLSATLGEQIRPYLETTPELILDVSGIQFNSMLIGEIVNLHQRFEQRWKERKHRIALVNLTDTSRAVFERVRLEAYFSIFDSVAEACNGAPHAP